MQSFIQLHDLKFKPYLTEEKILARVAELAKTISAENTDTHPVFLGVLNGSFMFAADLLKHVFVACEIAFIRSGSYVECKAAEH